MLQHLFTEFGWYRNTILELINPNLPYSITTANNNNIALIVRGYWNDLSMINRFWANVIYAAEVVVAAIS